MDQTQNKKWYQGRGLVAACVVASAVVHGGVLMIAAWMDVRLPESPSTEKPPMFEASLVEPMVVQVAMPPEPVLPPPPAPRPVVQPEKLVVVEPEETIPEQDDAEALMEKLELVAEVETELPEELPQEVLLEPAPDPIPEPEPVEAAVIEDAPPPVLEPIVVAEPEEPDLGVYWQQVRTEVAQRIRYPRGSALRGQSQTVRLRLEVGADGSLIDVETVAGDAPASIARAALSAVRRAAPFDPPGVSGGSVVAELPITFEAGR